MATALVEEWLAVIAGVGAGQVALLLVALGSAMQMLGVRALAMGFLASNAGMGERRSALPGRLTNGCRCPRRRCCSAAEA